MGYNFGGKRDRSTMWEGRRDRHRFRLAGGGFSFCVSKLGTAIEASVEVGEAHGEQKQRVKFHRVLSQHNTLLPKDFLDQSSLSLC